MSREPPKGTFGACGGAGWPNSTRRPCTLRAMSAAARDDADPLPAPGLADEMEQALLRHVRHAWFPRCVDRERGGFLSGFNRRWEPEGPQQRMLEFQARQTRTAARLARNHPSDGDLAEFALHGFRYLRDVMWDAAGGGGWFWMLEADGTPSAAETKHAHSASYGVQACALVHDVTGEPSALELAHEGFAWFERHGWDQEHDGYHGWFRRDGTVIRNAGELPAGLPAEDPLNHAVGQKDINVQGDWFESLLDFLPHDRDGAVRTRLESLGHLYLDRLTTSEGRTIFAFEPDWTPVPGPEQYGYNFQGAHRMLDAAQALPGLGLAERAEALAVHAFRSARRTGGGYAFSDGVKRRGPVDFSRFEPRRRAWWVQFEALRTAAQFAILPGRRQQAFRRVLERQWAYMRHKMFDERFDGVFGTDPSDLAPWERPRFRRAGPYGSKSSLWKDASHDADALVACVHVLRGEATANAAAK